MTQNFHPTEGAEIEAYLDSKPVNLRAALSEQDAYAGTTCHFTL